MFETHHLLPDVKDDVLAISSTDTRFNVQLSSTDLLLCHRVNQIFNVRLLWSHVQAI
jgi:hypothetical protein